MVGQRMRQRDRRPGTDRHRSRIGDRGSAVLPRLPSPRPERTFSASGAARPTCTKPPVHIPRSRRSLPTFAPTARPRPSSTRRLPVGKSRCAGDHCRGHRDNRARVSVRQCFYSVPARYAGRRLPVRLAARTVDLRRAKACRSRRSGGRTLRRGAGAAAAATVSTRHLPTIELHISVSNPWEESLAVLSQAPALASMT